MRQKEKYINGFKDAKRRFGHKLICLVVSFAFCLSMHGTHIVGGHLTYRCIQENSIEVTLTIRRDCANGSDNAPFDPQASIGVFDVYGSPAIYLGVSGQYLIPFTGSDTLSESIDLDCGFVGNPVCVHEATYKTIINLPDDNIGYYLSYQRCCRNGTLNNIVDPLNTGATYSVFISPTAMAECNMPPELGDWPSIYLCANEEFSFDYGAQEIEGDSVVYKFCTPKSGPPFDDPLPQPSNRPPYADALLVNGFSIDNFFGPGGRLDIDPKTGLITGMPSLLGQYQVAVCLEEYRNGELISETYRDFEYNVRICDADVVADFSAPGIVCDSLKVDFVNQSEGAGSYLWYFDYPANTLSSTEMNPTFAFPEPGEYTVQLEVQGDSESCAATIRKEITIVGDSFDTNIAASTSTCNADDISIELFIESNQDINVVNWQITFDGQTITRSGNPSLLDLPYDTDVDVVANIQSITGCISQTTEQLNFSSQFEETINYTIVSCDNEYLTATFTVDENTPMESSLVSRTWIFNIDGEVTNIIGDQAQIQIVYPADVQVQVVSDFGSSCTFTSTKEFTFDFADYLDYSIDFLSCKSANLINIRLTDNSISLPTGVMPVQVFWAVEQDGALTNYQAQQVDITLDINQLNKIIHIVEYENGCFGVDKRQIEINELIDLSKEIQTDVLSCSLDGVNVRATYDFPSVLGAFGVSSFRWTVATVDGVQNYTGREIEFMAPGENPIDVSLQLTLNNGCSFVFNNTIDDPILDYMGVISDVPALSCTDVPIQLLTEVNSGFTYQFEPTTGLDFSVDPNNPFVLPESSTTYTVSVTDGVCDAVFEVLINRTEDIIPQIVDINSDQGTIACDGSVSLRSLTADDRVVGYQWSLDPGFSSIVSRQETFTISQDIELATYYLRLEYDNSCFSGVGEITISRVDEQAPLVSNLSGNGSINCDENVRLSASIDTEIDVVFQWSLDDSFSSILFSGPVLEFVQNSTVQTYYVRAQYSNSCTSSVAVQSITIESLDIEGVEGDSFVLFVCDEVDNRFFDIVNPDFEYTYTPDEGLDFSSDPKNPIVLASGIVNYTISVSNGFCVRDLSAIILRANEVIPLIVNVSGEGDLNCDEHVVLSASEDLDLATNYEWSTDPNFLDIIAVGPRLEITQSEDDANYYVRAMYMQGCTSRVGTQNIKIERFPIPEVVGDDLTVNICVGEVLRFFNEINPDYTYVYAPFDGLDFSEDANNPRIVEGHLDSYTVTLSNGICSKDINATIEKFNDVEPVILNVSGSGDFNCDENIVLMVQGSFPENAMIEWSLDDSFTNIVGTTNQLSITQAVNVQNYYVRVKYNEGCISDTATQRITIETLPIDGLDGDNVLLLVCDEEENRFFDTVNADYTYTYSPTDGLDFSQDPNNPLILSDSQVIYTIEVSSVSCVRTLTASLLKTVEVIPLIVNISGEGDLNCDEHVVLSASEDLDMATNYEWSQDPNFLDIIAVGPRLEITQFEDDANYYVRAMYMQGCTSRVGTQNIKIERFPIPEVVGDDLTVNICGGEVLRFFNEINPDYTYVYAPFDGLDFSEDANNPRIVEGHLDSYTVTLSNGICSKDINVIIKDVESVSPVIVNVSGDGDLNCNENLVLLASLDGYSGFTFEWSLDATFSNIISTGENLETVQTANEQVYFVRAMFPNGCTSQSASQNIRIKEFSVDGLPDEGLELLACSEFGVRLLPNTQDEYTYIYSPLEGLDFSEDPNNPTAFVDATTVFTVTISYEECSKDYQISVVDLEDIKPVITSLSGNPNEACGGQVSLIANDTYNIGRYVWSDSPIFGNILSESNTLDLVQYSASATYYVKVVYDNGCESTVATITVELREGSLEDVPNDDVTLSLCDLNESRLLSNLNSNYTYEITPLEGLDFSTDSVNPLVVTDVDRTYMILVSDGECSVSYDINVLVSTENDLVFSGPIADGSVACDGLVDVSVMDGSDMAIGYQWSDTADFSNILSEEARFVSTLADNVKTYYVRAIYENDCERGEASINIRLSNLNLDALMSRDTLIACQGTGVRMLSFANPEFSYTYSPTTGLDFSNPQNPIALPDETTIYDVTVTNADGCMNTAQITVFRSEMIELMIAGAEEICGEVVNLSIDAPENPTLVEWSTDINFNNIIGISSDLVTTQSIDTQEYFVRASYRNGCKTAISTITVRQGDQFMNIQRDSLFLCEGSSVNLLLGADDRFSYTWDPTTGLDFTNGDHDPIATPEMSTTYIVTITDGACSYVDSIFVSTESAIDLEIINESDICTNDVNLGLNSPFTGITQWSDNENFNPVIGTGNSFMDTFEGLSQTYFVRQIFDNGCVSNVEQITVETKKITLDIDFSQSICFGDTVMIDLLGLDPGFNLDVVWTPDPHIISSVLLPKIQVVSLSEDDMFTLSYTAINQFDCFDIGEIDFVTNAKQAQPTTSFDVECNDFQICFQSNANTNAGTWDFGDLTTDLDISTASEACYNYPASGSYTINFSSNSNLCAFSDVSFDIMVPENFNLEIINATDTLDYCVDEAVELNATMSGRDSADLEWFNDKGEKVGTGFNISYTPGADEEFVALLGSTIDGCFSTDTLFLNNYIFNLDIQGPDVSCSGEAQMITVTNNGTGELAFAWSPSDCILEGADTATPTVWAQESKDIIGVITEINSGCSMDVTIPVLVSQFDIALASDTEDDFIYFAQDVTLTVSSDADNITYDWSTGDSGEMVMDSPTETTTYTVVATDEFGCSISEEITIEVRQPMCNETDVYLPNAFTPNGDNNNDVFIVRSNFIRDLEFWVVDRWGEEVFRTTDQTIGWNGRFNNIGEVQSPDAYAYCLRVTCVDGTEYTTTGNVSLIR